jgi:predicted Zn-dependent protease
MVKACLLLFVLTTLVFAYENEVEIQRSDRAAIDARLHEAIETAGILLEDVILEQHINGIVAQLTGIQPGTAPPYRIRIINSGELNAFSLSDGTVYMSLGIFGLIDNDAQLAMLLAHEIAHVNLDHHRLFRHELHRKTAASFWGGSTPYNLRVALSGFSKSQEFQADSIALQTVIERGYNAWAAKNLFRRMYYWLRYKEKSYKKEVTTHPKISQRYKIIVKRLKRLNIDSTRGIVGDSSYHTAVRHHQQKIINLLLQSNCVNELYVMALSKLDGNQPYPEWFYLRGSLMERYNPVDSFPVANYSLTTTIRNDPSFTAGFRDLGWLYLKNEQYDSARVYLSQYLTHTPNAPDSALILFYLESLNE